jgi:FIMAH domain-containing protein/type IX secretion system substrate protein
MKTKLLFSVLVLISAAILHAQVPDSPVLSEPPNLDMVSASGVKLEWINASGALWYMVEVSTDQNFTGSSLVYASTYTNYYVISLGLLTPNTTYYWRSMACNLFGTSPWSAVWSFTTAANAVQELSVLQNNINDLIAYGLISTNDAGWLNAKLVDATQRLAHGNDEAAVNNVNAFQNRVNALMHNRHINNETAQELNERGDYIIAVIRNPGNSPILQNEPIDFSLSQNYPNPFNPSTLITYALPQTEFVVLKVFDITGQEAVTLVNESQSKGKYAVTWNAQNFSSGIYIYTLNAGNFSESKLMLLTK